MKGSHKAKEKIDSPKHLRTLYTASNVKNSLFVIISETNVHARRAAPKATPNARFRADKSRRNTERVPLNRHKAASSNNIVFREGNVKSEE